MRLTRLSSRDGDLTLVPQYATQAGTVPTHTRPLSPSLDPHLPAPGRSAPSGYVPPVTPCPSPLLNPLAQSPLPPPRPRPLPRFKPTLTFPQLARLQPPPPPSPLPTPHSDLPATLLTTSNLASPSTSPTSLPPVPPRILSPKARPSTSLYRPSTSLLSPHPRPAPDMPLTHTSVTSPGPCSLPRKTGGSSRPRPSTSPFSIVQSYFDPLAHSPPRPDAHTSTPQPCPFPPPTADPVPPSNPLPESSSRRRKRRHRRLADTATPRIDHGTVRGSWSKSQLVNALSSLCDTPSQLKFTRLPGCGAHSQLRFPWKGNTVLVNTWHTGRVHLQGFGARDLARHLSVISISSSRVRTRSSSPGSSGDSSGVGNNPFWVGRNLCLTLFMWIIHLGIFAGLRLSGGLRLFSCFFPRRVFRRKKIRGSGSQAASRRGARPRIAALKARARQHSAILSTVLDFSRVCIPTVPWLLVHSRSKHLSSMFFLCCLFYFVFSLQGHGVSPVVDGSMFAYESGLGVGSLINQEGSFAWIAPAAVLTPIGQTVAQFVFWGISISARCLACVVVLVSVLALAVHLRSRALPVVPAPGVRTPFWSFFLSIVPASGTQDVPVGSSVVHNRPLNHRVLPSCDFCKLRKHFSVRRIGTVTMLAILACSVTPVLWQIGLDGVRVGEASHPGPAHPTPEGAPTTLNVSEVLTQVSRSDPSLPAAHSGAPVPGPSSPQAPHPYAAPPPPHPVLHSRPSRFCTPPLPRDSSRHLSGSPAPRRRRSRSPVRPSSALPQDPASDSGRSRVFCPVASCPDHAHPSHGWLSFQSMRPHIEAHLSGQLLGDISSEWLRSQGFGTCEVCHRILSLRYNGRCPSCFHTLVSARDRPPSTSRSLAEGAPSIWDVFVSGTRVRSSVPDSARALVLVAPSRGGRRHVLRTDNDTRRRCLDWINGIRADLWTPPYSRRGRPRKDVDTTAAEDVLPDAVVSRVSSLLKDGALRRACAALLQEPPVSPSADVVAALRVLHPAPEVADGADMLSLRPVASRAAPSVDVDSVRKAVHSFPSTSGAGKSGLRPSHLREATRPASSDLLFRLITEVVNLLLQGEVPDSVRPFVCGASVMSLRKPNGTLRPIAVGETFRRITGKVAVELISDRARAVLEPIQLGVKTPNGCEAIIHATRQWFHKHRLIPSKTAVSVDISNAFNTVNRSAVLQSVRTHFPSLAPWVDCCYRHDSHLFTGSDAASDQTISSSRGVQQGDPLGPVLFALAIHPVIQEALVDTERSFPAGLDICSFYLDDGLCAGDAQAVSFFLKALIRGLSRIGLVVNLAKTEVIPPCTSSQSFGPDLFPGCIWNSSASFSYLGLPSALLLGANFFWVVGCARLELLLMPLAGSQTLTGHSVF